MRIEICGGVASGKTTLARLLARRRFTPVLERFRDNPFYGAFYSDPAAHAFETEITFLLQHYHQIKIESKRSARICCDFSLVLDLAYAHVTLSRSKLSRFRDLEKFVAAQLPRGDLLIYLVCNANTELMRIRQRGRVVESRITLDYLRALDKSLRARVEAVTPSVRVLSINSSERDFAHSESTRRQVLVEIADAMA